MNPHDRQVIHSSAAACWRAPPDLFAVLDQEFAFLLDAAADDSNHLCSQWLGPGSEDPNALTANWGAVLAQIDDFDGGRQQRSVFLNPPYSVEERNRLTKLGDTTGAGAHDIEYWAHKCWYEAQQGCTIVGVFPHSVQTQWYRAYIRGLTAEGYWNGFAADQVREIPHRVSFPTAEGAKSNNAPGNTCIIIWRPDPGWVGPWTPTVRCWDYR